MNSFMIVFKQANKEVMIILCALCTPAIEAVSAHNIRLHKGVQII